MPPIRIAVTGRHGQIARALCECASAGRCEVRCIARPELDLSRPETIVAALAPVSADVLVNAAAYTDVDGAQAEPHLAALINARAPAALAVFAEARGIPLIHLSTDYVFDGTKSTPYVEDDPIGPLNVYGRTKAAGEQGVARAMAHHAILRTSWVYSPHGRNFVRTMLGLAARQAEVRVVADQVGQPTAATDIAHGIFAVARNLISASSPQSYGTFHMAAAGETSWAEFAEAIFQASRQRGGPAARVVPIATANYATRARRPANSRLDCSRIARVHKVALPHWRASLERCVGRILGVE